MIRRQDGREAHMKGTGAWEARENNFDFLRLALAVLVIYSHCYPLGAGDERAEPVLRMTHGQMTGGAVAVDLFFIMSGFLIAASAERTSSVRAFMKKRAARIYPAFCVLALVTLLFVLPLSGGRMSASSWGLRVLDFVVQTLRLREFGYTGAFAGNPYAGAVNGSVWSIQYEFWCYVGVALLAAVGLLRRQWVVLVGFLGALAVSVAWVVEGWVRGGKWVGVLMGSPQLWARLLPLYLAGVVFYLFREQIARTGWMAVGACVALATGAWVPHGLTAVFPVAGTYLIFYAAYAPWLRLHGFGRYGDFSYGTYLYAFPVQQVVMRAVGHAMTPWALFVWAAPLTFALAMGSWYGVERRFLVAKRREGTL